MGLFFRVLLGYLFIALGPLAAEKGVISKISLLEDKKNSLNIREIRQKQEQGQFSAHSGQYVSIGQRSWPVWVAIKIKNSSSGQNFILRVLSPLLDSITLYRPQGDGFEAVATGDLYSLASREVRNRAFAFNVRVMPNSTETFFLKVRSSSFLVMPIAILTKDRFSLETEYETYLFGAYFGLLLIIALYNLFLFFSLKDQAYLWYVLYLVFLWFFQAGNYGLSFQLFWPNLPAFANSSYALFSSGLILCVIMFAIKFLEIPRYFAKLKYVFYALMAIAIVGIPLTFWLANKLNNPLTALLGIIMLVTSLMSYRRGYEAARFFLAAWLAMIILSFLWILAIRGIIQSEFLFQYAFLGATTLEVVLFSLALADRINILKNEKEKADQEALMMKVRLLESFARFIPKQFLHFMGKSSVEEVRPGDAVQRDITIMFTDIRGFTTLSEALGPSDTFHFINAYLQRIEPGIQNNQGFIDKFIGDGILALFPESGESAIEAGISMLNLLKTYNKERATKGYEAIRVGIGLNHGSAMLGSVGTAQRIDTTVIGDSVNLAARIEALTKRLGAEILVADSVVRSLKDISKFHLREAAAVMVKGKTRPVLLYECFDADEPALRQKKIETLDNYREAMVYYRAGEFSTAMEKLDSCLSIVPNDTLFNYYLKRSKKMLKSPPGSNWRGIEDKL